MPSRKETASRDQLPMKSQQPDVIKGKDRQQITDVTKELYLEQETWEWV